MTTTAEISPAETALADLGDDDAVGIQIGEGGQHRMRAATQNADPDLGDRLTLAQVIDPSHLHRHIRGMVIAVIGQQGQQGMEAAVHHGRMEQVIAQMWLDAVRQLQLGQGFLAVNAD